MNIILSIISEPLGWIMRQIYLFVGNYGVTLILFTLFTKVILFPLAIKQKKSMIRMSAFQPVIQNIQKKYANNPAKQQEELARLQTEHGFSMTSGCLPMFIQLPILFGLIDVIYKPLHFILGVSNDVITRITPVAEGIVGTLSRYSPQSGIIVAIRQNPRAFESYLSEAQMSAISSFNMNFLGMDLTATPSLKVFNTLLLIPILSAAFMLIQMIVSTKLNGQKMEGSAKVMPFVSVAMFGYFAFMMPAGVSIYWIFSSVFGIVQEFILRIFFDPDKEKEKIKEEIERAKKTRKEKEKQKPAHTAKAVKGDKYVEDTYTEEEARIVKKRLEKARQLDKEKYGE